MPIPTTGKLYFTNIRRSGTGRGRRADEKKDGHGKGNWGDKPTYKAKKEEATEEEKVEVKEEKPVVEEKPVEYEVIGYSMDEVLAQKAFAAKKAARQSEGIKGTKVQEGELKTAEKAATLKANSYAKDTLAKTADPNAVLFGFGDASRREDDSAPRGGRGGRGGRGAPQAARQGGRRQNAK